VPVIEYVLNSATVGGADQAAINFQILRDGVPLDLLNLPTDLTTASNRPSFVLAYALPQNLITDPAEYNNLGRSGAQPQTVSISAVDSMVDNGDGTFTATIDGAFPAGATLRAVGLQGYFQVTLGGENTPLHTPSAVVAVSGDAERREVVDNNNCASCHEWLEAHGGNRVFNMNICVMCHVPNLSSSGRSITDPSSDLVADLTAADIDGVDPNDPLTYPEATNNFKDMIHGIHGAATRTTDYQFVRNFRGGSYYNWSDVVFPASASDCLRCHKSETFEVPLNANTLLTTNRTTGEVDGQDATEADVSDARDTVPNATDFVITPTAAACYACHDSQLAQAHMADNGGVINDNRSTVLDAGSVETCQICHGPGKSQDLEVVHAAEKFTLIGTITAPESGGGDGDGGSSQADLCGPGPISARPPGHTTRLDCCSCHGFN
jgi:OmcA/MtrC family decaheme c-type cytochrome